MKIKKILATILGIIMLIIPINFQVSAAENPYPSSQTIGGITTIPCTRYAWQQAFDKLGIILPNWGNAINWLSKAVNSGYSTGSVAKSNSIAVWQSSSHSYGHVSFVTAVNGNTMTVNEGGMTINNKPANGNGIITGSTVSSIVGTKKSTYSSCTLLGFIYLNGTPNISIHYTPYYNKNWSNSTNAEVFCRVDKTVGLKIEKIGIRVRQENSSYSQGWKHIQTPNSTRENESWFNLQWNMNTEVGLTLTHLTKYYYQFYVKISGKEFWSAEYDFTTTGSHNYWTGYEKDHPHKYYKKCECGYYYYTGKTAAEIIPATCTTPATCKVCNRVEADSLGHTGGTATCKSKAKCTRCGEEYGNFANHNYSTATCSKPKTCKNCGKTSGTALSHKYSNKCDTTCNVCKATRKITHTYKTLTTKATLTKNGKIVKKCDVCGKIASNTVIKYPKTIKLSAKSYTYNGKTRTPSITVKDSLGKTISSKYYTVKYSSGRTKVGTYKVTVTFKENYSGSKTLSFAILPQFRKENGVWKYYKGDGTLNKANTLVKHTNGKWYHVNGGKLVKDTTLVKYNNTWWYVKEGVKNNSNTLCKYNNKWYHVKGGKVVKDTAIIKYGSKYYFVQNGIKSNKSGTIKYSGITFKIKNGVVQ